MEMSVKEKQSKQRTAFTLVELLVTMAIVGILASLLLAVISKARSKARLAACQNNFRQLITAWTLYADNYQGRLVNNVHLDRTNSWVKESVSKFGKDGVTNWHYLVGKEHALFAPYISTAKTYHCPSDASKAEIEGRKLRRVRSVSMNQAMGYESAAMWLPSLAYAVLSGQQAFETYRYRGDIGETSERFVFIGESDRTINDCAFGLQMPQEKNPRPIWVDVPTVRHGGSGVLGYADGHIEAHQWRDSRTAKAYFRSSSARNEDWHWLASKTSAPIEQ